MYTCLIRSLRSCYCVVAFSGRVDRVFQVLLEQEENIIVGDMLSDGILVVESAFSISADINGT